MDKSESTSISRRRIDDVLTHISEKPWSDYTSSDYTPEQWHTSCLIHQHEGAPTSKGQCKLPVRTPSGIVNRNGVYSATAALGGARGGVNASEDEKAIAARALIRLYKEMDKEPPPSLLSHSIDNILLHYGKKGMHWGVITNKINPDRSVPKNVVLKETPGKLVKTSGGQFHPASDDARNAAAGRQMIKKSSIDVLSNKELQAVVTRMNLEQQYSNLKKNPRASSDHAKIFVKKHGIKAVIVGITTFKTDPRISIPKKIGAAIVKAAMSTQKQPEGQGKKKKKKKEEEED